MILIYCLLFSRHYYVSWLVNKNPSLGLPNNPHVYLLRTYTHDSLSPANNLICCNVPPHPPTLLPVDRSSRPGQDDSFIRFGSNTIKESHKNMNLRCCYCSRWRRWSSWKVLTWPRSCLADCAVITDVGRLKVYRVSSRGRTAGCVEGAPYLYWLPGTTTYTRTGNDNSQSSNYK